MSVSHVLGTGAVSSVTDVVHICGSLCTLSSRLPFCLADQTVSVCLSLPPGKADWWACAVPQGRGAEADDSASRELLIESKNCTK